MSDEGAVEQNAPPEPKRGFFDRGRLGRLTAILGVFAFVLSARWLVFPHVPQEHDIEVRLGSSGDVVAVDVRWSAAGSSDDIVTTSLRFPPGTAPSAVLTKVSLPDGAYDVAIHVERVSSVDSTRRRITLDDTRRVTIPLR